MIPAAGSLKADPRGPGRKGLEPGARRGQQGPAEDVGGDRGEEGTVGRRGPWGRRRRGYSEVRSLKTFHSHTQDGHLGLNMPSA